MQHTSILVALDTRVQKKDGTYPVILRLTHNRKTSSITTGVTISEKDWDPKNRSIRKSFADTSSVTRLNNLLQKKKSEALDAIVKLDEEGILATLSINDLRSRLAFKDDAQSFFTYAKGVIADLYTASRVGTAKSYEGAMRVLKTFNKGKDLEFSAITYAFLSKFETNHKSNGNGANGLAVYMRSIRAIYNRGMKEGRVEKTSYPFAEYKIKTAPTEKRALDPESLKAIIEQELPQTHPCFHARNYFLASFMLYGMNFTDIAHMEKGDIEVGRIHYRRKKTGKLFDIKITDGLSSIIDYYMSSHPDSPYVFPILKRDTAKGQDKDIQWARKRYNKKLKMLAELCGIEKNLTSYVSRHSFATHALLKQVPVAAISAMLGHSSLKTTEVYLKSLPTNVLDGYNEVVLKTG